MDPILGRNGEYEREKPWKLTKKDPILSSGSFHREKETTGQETITAIIQGNVRNLRETEILNCQGSIKELTGKRIENYSCPLNTAVLNCVSLVRHRFCFSIDPHSSNPHHSRVNSGWDMCVQRRT